MSLNSDGISPILGIVLLIVITLGIAGTIGYFAVNLDDNSANSQAGVQTDKSEEGFSVQVVDSGNSESVQIKINGQDVDSIQSGAGNKINISEKTQLCRGDKVTMISEGKNNEDTVISSETVEEDISCGVSDTTTTSTASYDGSSWIIDTYLENTGTEEKYYVVTVSNGEDQQVTETVTLQPGESQTVTSGDDETLNYSQSDPISVGVLSPDGSSSEYTLTGGGLTSSSTSLSTTRTDWSGGDSAESYYYSPSGDDNTTVSSNDSFSSSITSSTDSGTAVTLSSSRVQEGETVSAVATITTTKNPKAQETIIIYATETNTSANIVSKKTHTIEKGSEKTSMSEFSIDNAGEYVITASLKGSSEMYRAGTLNVVSPSNIQVSGTSTSDGNNDGTYTLNENVTLSGDITNSSSESKILTVEFFEDGTKINSKEVTVSSNSTKTVTESFSPETEGLKTFHMGVVEPAVVKQIGEQYITSQSPTIFSHKFNDGSLGSEWTVWQNNWEVYSTDQSGRESNYLQGNRVGESHPAGAYYGNSWNSVGMVMRESTQAYGDWYLDINWNKGPVNQSYENVWLVAQDPDNDQIIEKGYYLEFEGDGSFDPHRIHLIKRINGSEYQILQNADTTTSENYGGDLNSGTDVRVVRRSDGTFEFYFGSDFENADLSNRTPLRTVQDNEIQNSQYFGSQLRTGDGGENSTGIAWNWMRFEQVTTTTVSVSHSPEEPNTGETVTFTADASHSQSGVSIDKYQWEFEDGKTATTTDSTYKRTFKENGKYIEYTVTAVASNGDTQTTGGSVLVPFTNSVENFSTRFNEGTVSSDWVTWQDNWEVYNDSGGSGREDNYLQGNRAGDSYTSIEGWNSVGLLARQSDTAYADWYLDINWDKGPVNQSYENVWLVAQDPDNDQIIEKGYYLEFEGDGSFDPHRIHLMKRINGSEYQILQNADTTTSENYGGDLNSGTDVRVVRRSDGTFEFYFGSDFENADLSNRTPLRTVQDNEIQSSEYFALQLRTGDGGENDTGIAWNWIRQEKLSN